MKYDSDRIVGRLRRQYLAAFVILQVAIQLGAAAYGDEQREKIRTFIAAAKRGDLEAVDAAIKAGFDVNATLGGDSISALDWAAERSHVDVLKRLLEAGADPNATKSRADVFKRLLENPNATKSIANSIERLIENPNAKTYLKRTPLHWAAIRGPREAVQALIDAGAEVDAISQQQGTPLGSAAGAGNLEAAIALIDSGADVNGGTYMTPIAEATRSGHVPLINLLAKNGANINDPKNPPIHWAGKPELAKALLEAGAQLNLRNRDGETALHLTTGHWIPDAATVKFLIDAGADVNAKNSKNSTPLHEAIRHGKLAIVEQLLLGGADLNAKDDEGYTPLSLAKLVDESFVALLVDAGATDDGKTELQHAIDSGKLPQVNELIAAGADVNETGPGGRTAAHIASERGHSAILATLIDAGAKPDERDNDGFRPLHLAADATSAEILIAAGANVSADKGMDELSILEDPEDVLVGAYQTPMYMAATSGRADVVRVLIEKGADINDGNGIETIIWATYFGRLQVVRVLLENGEDSQSNNRLISQSALHITASGGFADTRSPEHVTPEIRLQIAKLLIEKGADVNPAAEVGGESDMTPLTYAAKDGQFEMVELFLNNGAKVNAAPTDGMFSGYSPLHGASQSGHENIVTLLLKRQANANALTGGSYFDGVVTPLDLAAESRIRELLRQRGGKPASELTDGVNACSLK